MKKLFFAKLFFLFFFQMKAQYSMDKLSIDYSSQVLRFVIKNNSLKEYNNVIVSEIDSSVVEFTLRNLKTQKLFKSIDTAKNEIKLTDIEKKFILTSFKQQYNYKWTNEEFTNINVIKQENLKEYVKLDK